MRALRVLREHGEAISAAVRVDVTALLAADASPAGRVLAARRAHEALDEAGRRACSLVKAPACAAGCASCCHVHVDATEPEILAVAAHLAGTLDPGALAALVDRLAAHVQRVGSLDDEERWRAAIPCALLTDDGRCSVHEARPLRCRAFHSSSADACRDALAGRDDRDPPTIPALDRAHDAALRGFDEALAAAGLPVAPERLEPGLLAVLRARLGA